MIRAVIFDMDGVLIDAKEWHYEALNRALWLFGYQISLHDHLTTYNGLPTRKKLEVLSLVSQEQSLPRSLHSFINEMKQRYTMELVHTLCRPTFAHEFALARLREMDYRLAVASNSVRNTVEVMMEKACLTDFMEMMVSNEDVTHPKPHPEMYNKIIAAFKLQPAECLIVEDNENGVKAAQASGAHVMVVGSVHDVQFDNIMRHIRKFEAGDVV